MASPCEPRGAERIARNDNRILKALTETGKLVP